MNPKSLDKLIGAFMMLPGVGRKTAERYAYCILSADKNEVKKLSEAITEAKEHIKFCEVCGNFSEDDICPLCLSRPQDIICVVREPRDVAALERVRSLKCAYHVLHGCISPLDGVTADDIRIKELLRRITTPSATAAPLHGGEFGQAAGGQTGQNFNGQCAVREVIMATNPDVEGEATALYIAKILKPFGVKVTRLAQGISIGSDLQYADEVTLSRAIESRREI